MIASSLTGALEMVADTVLEQLADGQFHSGQGLADELGVSRTAVWKQIRSLAALGVDVERVRGKGYRVPGGLDLLNEDAIRAGLSKAAIPYLGELEVFQRIDSTNAELQRRGTLPGAARVCLAEHQSAGRGRRGKAWVSPYGSNIYCSVGWSFDGGAEVLEGLSLAVGVILCDALTALGAKGQTLKWPNDVLLDGAKLAGILVEMQGDLAGPVSAVIGMGINVQMPCGAGEQIDQSWTDLRSHISLDSRSALVGELLNRLLPALAEYEQSGFEPWRDRWMALDCYAGQPVQVLSGERRTLGVARGVDARGALLLETASGVSPVHGGEVSLRPAS